MNKRSPVCVVWNAQDTRKQIGLPPGFSWGVWSLARNHEILELITQAWNLRHEGRGDLTNIPENDLLDTIFSPASVTIERNNEIIAAALTGAYWGLRPLKPLGMIYIVAVSPQYQGAGLGPANLFHILDIFKGLGFGWVISSLFLPDTTRRVKALGALGCYDYDRWIYEYKDHAAAEVFNRLWFRRKFGAMVER